MCGTVNFDNLGDGHVAYNATSFVIDKEMENLGGWDLDTSKYSSTYYYIYKPILIDEGGEKWYIAVPKDNTSVGKIGTTEGIGLSDIGLANADELGPEKINFIKKGNFWGYLYKSGEWKSEFDEIMETSSKMYLSYFSPIKGKWEYVQDRCVDNKIKEGVYQYCRFTISEFTDDRGLPEGKYALGYYHSERADLTGDAKGDWTQLLPLVGGVAEFSGEAQFDLRLITSGANKGYGLIDFIENYDADKKNIGTKTLNTNITNPAEGVRINVTESHSNALTDALINSIKIIGNSINYFTTLVTGWINEVLVNTTDIDNTVLKRISKDIRNITLSLLTLALLIIAFANILNIQIEQYGLTRIIPKLIIAAIMAYFSYLIALFLLNLMNAMQALMVSGVGANNVADIAGTFNDTVVSNSPSGDFWNGFLKGVGFIPQAIILIILALFMLLVVIWLLLILIVRKAVLMILVAIAPLAFLMNILPFTESYYKQWWARFWQWAFMGPAIVLMLYLSNEFMTIGFFGSIDSFEASAGETWVYLIVSAVLLFFAGYIPLIMGKEIYGGIKNIGQKAGQRTGVSQYLAARKGDREARIARRAERARLGLSQTKLGKAPIIGSVLTGVKGDEERQAALDKLKGGFKQGYTKKTKKELNTMLTDGKVKGLEKEALVDYLVETGQGDMEAQDASGNYVVAQAFAERAATDGQFLQTMKDKQIDAFGKISSLESTGQIALSTDAKKTANAEAYKSVLGKEAKELKPAQIEYLAKANPNVFNQLVGDKNYMKNLLEDGGPGAKAAWGEAIRMRNSSNADPEMQSIYNELVSAATQTEVNARKQTEAQGQDASEAKNALGELSTMREYNPQGASDQNQQNQTDVPTYTPAEAQRIIEEERRNRQ
ncbi:MAG: hypothetical protein PHW75_01695 [Patescibacteria group bacterium]|nr:hypothetical protein [Patescibacteria group bacterium]